MDFRKMEVKTELGFTSMTAKQPRRQTQSKEEGKYYYYDYCKLRQEIPPFPLVIHSFLFS